MNGDGAQRTETSRIWLLRVAPITAIKWAGMFVLWVLSVVVVGKWSVGQELSPLSTISLVADILGIAIGILGVFFFSTRKR